MQTIKRHRIKIILGLLVVLGVGTFLWFAKVEADKSAQDMDAIRAFMADESLELDFTDYREPSNFQILDEGTPEESDLIIMRPAEGWDRKVTVYQTVKALNRTCARYEFEVYQKGHEVTSAKPIHQEGCTEESLYSPQLSENDLWAIGFDFIEQAIGANFYRISHEATNGGADSRNPDGSTKVFAWSWRDPEYQLPEGLVAAEDMGTVPNIRLRVTGAGKLLSYSNTTPFFQQPSLTDPDGPFDLPEGTPSGRKAELIEFQQYELSQDTPENRERANVLGMLPRDYFYTVAHYNLEKQPAAELGDTHVLLFSYPLDWQNFRDGFVEALSGPETIWKVRVAGLINDNYLFKDIDKDGTPEIEIVSDGGGNTYHCVLAYYRWTGSTFEIVRWEPDMEDMDCGGGELTYENGTAVYTSSAFFYDGEADSNVEEENRPCYRWNTRWEYDSRNGIFKKMSETKGELIDDGYLYFCR